MSQQIGDEKTTGKDSEEHVHAYEKIEAHGVGNSGESQSFVPNDLFIASIILALLAICVVVCFVVRFLVDFNMQNQEDDDFGFERRKKRRRVRETETCATES